MILFSRILYACRILMSPQEVILSHFSLLEVRRYSYFFIWND